MHEALIAAVCTDERGKAGAHNCAEGPMSSARRLKRTVVVRLLVPKPVLLLTCRAGFRRY
jgi:hypothetical protein